MIATTDADVAAALTYTDMLTALVVVAIIVGYLVWWARLHRHVPLEQLHDDAGRGLTPDYSLFLEDWSSTERVMLGPLDTRAAWRVVPAPNRPYDWSTEDDH